MPWAGSESHWLTFRTHSPITHHTAAPRLASRARWRNPKTPFPVSLHCTPAKREHAEQDFAIDAYFTFQYFARQLPQLPLILMDSRGVPIPNSHRVLVHEAAIVRQQEPIHVHGRRAYRGEAEVHAVHPRRDEDGDAKEERPVVGGPDALVDPHAVVIASGHAHVAHRTVAAPRRDLHFANLAPREIWDRGTGQLDTGHKSAEGLSDKAVHDD